MLRLNEKNKQKPKTKYKKTNNNLWTTYTKIRSIKFQIKTLSKMIKILRKHKVKEQQQVLLSSQVKTKLRKKLLN